MILVAALENVATDFRTRGLIEGSVTRPWSRLRAWQLFRPPSRFDLPQISPLFRSVPQWRINNNLPSVINTCYAVPWSQATFIGPAHRGITHRPTSLKLGPTNNRHLVYITCTSSDTQISLQEK